MIRGYEIELLKPWNRHEETAIEYDLIAVAYLFCGFNSPTMCTYLFISPRRLHGAFSSIFKVNFDSTLLYFQAMDQVLEQLFKLDKHFSYSIKSSSYISIIIQFSKQKMQNE